MGPKSGWFLVEHRFVNGTASMLIDLDRCTRCDDCVRACAVAHDNNPRFVRHYANLAESMRTAVGRYVDDVKKGKFPADSESYD